MSFVSTKSESSLPPVDPPPLETYLGRMREALLTSGETSVSHLKLMSIWADIMPAHAKSFNAPMSILAALEALAAEKFIRFPSRKDNEAWLTRYNRPFPRTISVAIPRSKPAAKNFDIVWHPLLDAASRTKNPIRLKKLRQISTWLIANPAPQTLVPLRERSMEIFGDEEALENLAYDHESEILFKDGPVDYKDVSAFVPAFPLPSESTKGSAGRPILVVESLHTWWTVCKWNASMKLYSSVIFGQGNAAQSATAFIAEKAAGDGIHYLCDLRTTSLTQMEQLSVRLQGRGCQRVVFPAWACRIMLKKFRKPDPVEGACVTGFVDGITDLERIQLTHHLVRKDKIPTEIIGFKDLMVLESLN